jgi:serine protease AprX
VARSQRAAALLAASLVSAGLVAAPLAAAQPLTAVVTFAGPARDALRTSGVRVVRRHDNLDAATVRGTPLQLARLAHSPGIRAVAPDAALRPNGHDGDDGQRQSVLPWQRLGGNAGDRRAGNGVRVALVDTGVADSAALTRSSGRLVDGVDTSGAGTFADGYGHGTFMAGIIAGGPVSGTNGRALGVAPGATVVSVKVADASGTTSLSKVVAGLDWVAGHARSLDVASFSFSRTRPGRGYGPDPLTDAVERVRNAGVTVVVSAGNVPGEVGDPGFDPKVLTVGAADVRNGKATVASFSGSAVVAGVQKPDLVGSGVGVLSVLPPRSVIAQQNPQARHGDALWRGSGTSQATAQAAGVAALYLAEHRDATPAQVKTALRSAAKRLGKTSRAGAGLLKAGRDGDDEDDSDDHGNDHGNGGGDGGGDGWGNGSAGNGEGGFDANSWSANSWSANSWSANSWSANSWSANSWSANSWSGNSWLSEGDD